MKDIVKYHNDLNRVSFKNFTAVDFNVFMAICSQIKDKNTEKVVFSFNEIKKLAGIYRNGKKNYTITQFHKEILNIGKKLIALDFSEVIEDTGDQSIFVLFPTFTSNPKTQTLTVEINKHAVYMLNDLANRFTSFELQEYVQLDSKYAKTLYRLLKQFKTTGEWKISVDKFRELLDVPQSYGNNIVTRDIINPTVKALTESFPNLEVEVLRSSKRGRPVTGYIFRFDADNPISPKQMNWNKKMPKKKSVFMRFPNKFR